MKQSASFISLVALAHLAFVDTIFFLIVPEPLIDYLVLMGYNIIWLLIVTLIWNHNYHETSS